MSGRVLYASFATGRHSGGVHVHTQHVALLRAAGRDARLWLPAADRPGWIGADVPVVHGPTTDLGADDLLVLPEVPVVPGRDPAPGGRTVIFNQNHFYTFAAWSGGGAYPGWERAPALWCVSTESRDVLAAVHPGLGVHLVPNPVDGALFTPGRPGPPRVAWFPRKRPREAGLLHELLRRDERLAGVELVELVDRPRSEVAAVLGASTVFVALSHSESFGLPVAEALASGCLVAGYDGGGGHELFDAPGAWAVPAQRPLLLRERVVDLVRRAPGLADVRAANRAWVLQRYAAERTGAALLTAVDAALDRPGAATTATHPAAWLDELPPGWTAWA